MLTLDQLQIGVEPGQWVTARHSDATPGSAACKRAADVSDRDEDKGSDEGYDLSDGEWLSYAELATRRGIDRQSAFKLAARHRWRRQKGNTGQVRVFVPSAFAEPEDRSSDGGYDLSHPCGIPGPIAGTHLAAFETALAAVTEAHAAAVAALREQLNRAERDQADAVAALGDERQRADDLRTQIAVLHVEMEVLRSGLGG